MPNDAIKPTGLSEYKLKTLWSASVPEMSGEVFDVSPFQRKAQSNLFWLCGLLGYAVTEKAHRDVCENFFIKKNPDVPIEDLIAEVPADRLLFGPRGGYKSSIRNADFVQWIIAYPDIKLAVQSSKQDRASDFTDEIAQHFLASEESEGGLILSRFQRLFPEHVASQRSQRASGTFTTPARTRYSKEPTISSLGIDESKASTHFHVGCSDDAISESNSGPDSTPEARANLAKKLLESRNLFDVFRFYLGTPTEFADDGYCVLQENLGNDLYVLVKSAWTVKPPSKKEPDDLGLTEEEVDLLFPFDARGKAKLTFKSLKTMLKGGADSFRTQQLCKTIIQKSKIQVTREMISSHTLPLGFDFNPLPVVSVWDLGYAKSDKSDFSVGCAGSQDDIRGATVKDIVRGRYQKADLIRAIVTQAIQFQVRHLWIEDTNGTRWLEDDILAALHEAGSYTTRVGYIPIARTSSRSLASSPDARMLTGATIQ